MTTRIVTRRAGPADLDELLNDVAAGFASYVAFAPPGWQPPDIHSRRDWQGEILADATWALLAVVDESPVGHVAFIPGRERHAAETRGTMPAPDASTSGGGGRSSARTGTSTWRCR